MDLGIHGVVDAVRIGRGGFAVVYRAFQPDLDRVIAVKLLPLTEHLSLRRFDRERKAMGRLSQHPGIVTVYDSGYTTRDEPYLLMGYHPAGSLQDRLSREGPLEWREAVELMIEVADTLEYAHAEGVVHRDLKPANILISQGGRPLVTDFGVAQLADRMPTSTILPLTPAYSAPELLEGTEAGVGADVYALGATLFALITASVPFGSAQTPAEVAVVAHRVATEPVPDLRPAGIPEAVCAVIEHAMAKAPEDRPASAAELTSELRRAILEPQGDPTVVPSPPSTVRPDRAPVAVGEGSAEHDDDDLSLREPEPETHLDFGIVMESPDARHAVRIKSPVGTSFRRLIPHITAAAGLDGDGWHVRRIIDQVPIASSLPVEGQIMHGQRLSFSLTLPERYPSVPGPMMLAVVGGPNAGARFDLAPGSYVMGRDESADITIPDPAISRSHVEITVAPAGSVATIADLGSANGTYVDGERIEGVRAIAIDEVVEVGRTLLSLRPTRALGHPAGPKPWIEFTRATRPEDAPSEQAFTVPAPQQTGSDTGRRTPGGRLLARLVGGESATREDPVDRALSAIEAANRAETSTRHAAAPDPLRIEDGARMRTEGLWVRRPGDHDYLNVRVGWADQPARFSVTVERFDDPERQTAVETELRRLRTIGAAPVTVSLTDSGVVGIAGDEPSVDGTARWLVTQLAALHSPEEVALAAVVAAESSAVWDWLHWLPHTRTAVSPSLAASPAGAIEALDALGALVASRDGAASGKREPDVVVIIQEAAVPDLSMVQLLLTDGPQVGVHTIWIGNSAAELPKQCGAVLSVTGGSGDLELEMGVAGANTRGAFDAVSEDYARGIAEALAPLLPADSELSRGIVRGVRPREHDGAAQIAVSRLSFRGGAEPT